MTDLELHRQAVIASPEDQTARLAYADHLREAGFDELADAFARPMHINSPFDSLIGKVVTGLAMTDDVLVVRTARESIAFELGSDCCSESWYFRLRGVKNLIGKEVVGVAEEKIGDVDVDDGLCRQEYDEAYGYVLLTDAGEFEVVFRNSSNGYYGGWMEQTDRMPTALREVTEDWQAVAEAVK